MSRAPDSARPIRVLFVEQAIAFGGAFVVIAELIRRLCGGRVQSSVITAMAQFSRPDGHASNHCIRPVVYPSDGMPKDVKTGFSFWLSWHEQFPASGKARHATGSRDVEENSAR